MILHDKTVLVTGGAGSMEKALEFSIGGVRDYAYVCSAAGIANIVNNAVAMKQVSPCGFPPLGNAGKLVWEQ